MQEGNRQLKRTGFTLIELLVVVAIIAVLVAVLLPAMQQARKNARTIVCQSNLKQLSMLFQQYADANAEFLPPGWTNDVSKNMSPYSWLGSWAGEVAKFMFPNATCREDLGKSLSIFFCPESEKEVFNSSGSAQAGYIYSWMIHNANAYWSVAGPIGRRGRPNCPDEKRVVLHCARIDFNGYYSLMGSPWCQGAGWQNWYEECLGKFHNDGANFLFVAGNIKWVESRGNYIMYLDGAFGNNDIRWW